MPLTAIEILLALVDVKTGNYNPELSVGLFSGIFFVAAIRPKSPRLSSDGDVSMGNVQRSQMWRRSNALG